MPVQCLSGKAMAQAWNPTVACTPTKIRKQIAECEALTIAASLKGEKQVEKERQRLEEVLKRREEIVESHQKVLAKMTEEHDTSLRMMVHKTKCDLDESANIQMRADEERKRMQEKADELDKKKVILEKEVKRLYSLLDKLQKDFDQRRNMMMDVAEDTVRQSFHCTAEEVRNTALFAQEVQMDAFMTIDRMQEEIKSTAEVADAMAEARSRFEALHKVGASRTIKGISEANFQNEKQEIMQSGGVIGKATLLRSLQGHLLWPRSPPQDRTRQWSPQGPVPGLWSLPDKRQKSSRWQSRIEPMPCQ